MLSANYTHFGGRHAESAALKNLLAFAGMANPHDGRPFSEPLCFGLAGGIGIGYSFCPSVIRWGCGSGISIPGRYKAYATDAVWYEGFFARLGLKTRITETAAPGKAYQNLVAELQAQRPTVVWCGRNCLGFLGYPTDMCNGSMHTFIVFGIDEDKKLAFGSDRGATAVTLTLDELAQARAKVCSHKNRTLTFTPSASLSLETLKKAVAEAIRLGTQGLLDGKIKTYSLPGLEIWAKMLVNSTNKEGWLKVFKGGLLYQALREVYFSIQTMDGAGGLHRGMYADFLDEAAAITQNPELAGSAREYRALARQWTELAEQSLPNKIKPFKQTKELMAKQCRAFLEKGTQGLPAMTEAADKLRGLQGEIKEFPLDAAGTKMLLEELSGRVTALHAAERAAAQKLHALV